jgi:hypothetical protein
MKKIILPLIALLFSLSVLSQEGRDKIKALKVSFITEKLELTQAEAQQFWPVYNEYEKVTLKIKFEDLRNIRHEIKDNINSLTDKKASELLDKLSKAENKLHEEENNLNTKLLKIISPKKILLLKVAEEDFKRKMFDQYKKMKRDNKQD